MSQCVPSWDVDDYPTPANLNLHANSNSNFFAPDVPILDYGVAELTWKNGQLAIHGLGHPRVPNKLRATSSPATKYGAWDKPRAGGTLESVVNQATRRPPHLKSSGGPDDLVPWFNHQSAATVVTTAMTDAMVPCSKKAAEEIPAAAAAAAHVPVPGISTCGVGCSTGVGSCSGAAASENTTDDVGLRSGSWVARVPVAGAREWSSRDNSGSGSGGTCGSFGRDSRQVTFDTCERELGVGGFTSTSTGSPGNTSSGKQYTAATTTDDHDSVCHSKRQREERDEKDKKKASGKSCGSTKRSRAAAVHNQSERKRRDKINQRIHMLQKLVPNSSKTDKASMLDEVIEYLKQLQAQINMMSRMNMSPMMMPITLQQQLQMSMMSPMGMGVNMGMGMGMGMGMNHVMDMNTLGRLNMAGISPAALLHHPTATFMPLSSWDGAGGDRLSAAATVMPDPLSNFLACQSQPMTMDAYSRMAALYQQMHQPPASGSKN